MNTSLPGSRSSWPANQACLRARTSDLPCSLACAVFFECHTVTLEKAPHRALRYPKVTAVLKMSSDLRKGHVRGLIDQRKDLLTVGFGAADGKVLTTGTTTVSSTFDPTVTQLIPIDGGGDLWIGIGGSATTRPDQTDGFYTGTITLTVSYL